MALLSRYLAKSGTPGEALTAHSAAAEEMLRVIARRTGPLPNGGPRFWWRARLACLCHDAGKILEGFQRQLGNPPPAKVWGERHEIYSLAFVEHVLAHLGPDDRLWIGLGVLTHHRPLTGGRHSIARHLLRLRTPQQLEAAFGPLDRQAADELAAWLARRAAAPRPVPAGSAVLAEGAHRLAEHILDEWEEAPTEQAGLAGVLMQGAVTMADHAASAHITLHTRHLLGPDYAHTLRRRFEAQDKHLFDHQLQAEQHLGHMLLRAPTGSGKTEACLLWATTQIQQMADQDACAPRLYYTLPYLASINATALRLGETELGDPGLERIGIGHSRAAAFLLAQEHTDEQADERAAASRALAKADAARLHRELVRVGTPYQLLRGAIGGTAWSSSLLDAANSVFVFDELHAYDTRRLGMILAMMAQWEQLGGRIAIVSATLPRALEEAIGSALEKPVRTIEPAADRPWPRRHRLHLDEQHLTAPETIEQIRAELAQGHSVLAVANNVADALHLYEELAPAAREIFGEADAALLLHSRFTSGDRNMIEEKIRDQYRTGTSPRSGGLLVSTQVLEISLDVDLTRLHTSGAPIEALIQRLGRANRAGRLDPVPVVVHRPAYAPRAGGAEVFADKVYPQAPTELGWAILERNDGTVIDERVLAGWLDEVYDGDWGKQWRRDLQATLKAFGEDFLSFTAPFDDPQQLMEGFDRMFDGIEGIWSGHLTDYKAALAGTARHPGEHPGAGRLLASRYRIPLPHHARYSGRWDQELKVLVVDGDYTSEKGLVSITGAHASGRSRYEPGEVI